MAAVDMARIREEHGLLQARLETRAVETTGNRYGTVSFRRGHRHGFWAGLQLALENPGLFANTPEAPADGMMTVSEFAAKHCAQHEGLTEQQVKAHVDGIILAAVSRGDSLWSVGIDAEGRVSLIWASLPEEKWEQLLAAGVQLTAVLAALGMLS